MSKKVWVIAICAFIGVAAAITAIYIFRNEIADFFVDIKEKIDFKKLRRKDDFDDFADV